MFGSQTGSNRRNHRHWSSCTRGHKDIWRELICTSCIERGWDFYLIEPRRLMRKVYIERWALSFMFKLPATTQSNHFRMWNFVRMQRDSNLKIGLQDSMPKNLSRSGCSTSLNEIMSHSFHPRTSSGQRQFCMRSKMAIWWQRTRIISHVSKLCKELKYYDFQISEVTLPQW